MIVSDALLRQLSAETKKVGRKVLIRETRLMPELTACISNVIIIPHSEFYRNKFMSYYRHYQQNSVKALKELAANFPYTPDYELGLAFVIILRSNVSEHPGHVKILLVSEFELIEENSFEEFRQTI